MSKEIAGSEARARIDDSVRQVWLAYRAASDVSVDMLTEQDMELWDIVTRHPAIQDRLNAMLPNNAGRTAGSAATSTRRAHLINAIRVWLNRAISHAENGNAGKTESAVRSAREVLAALESETLNVLSVATVAGAAHGSGASDEPCPLCEARGVRWIKPYPASQPTYVIAEACVDCGGKGRRPVRPNVDLASVRHSAKAIGS